MKFSYGWTLLTVALVCLQIKSAYAAALHSEFEPLEIVPVVSSAQVEYLWLSVPL
jgi:hypothetical protein